MRGGETCHVPGPSKKGEKNFWKVDMRDLVCSRYISPLAVYALTRKTGRV